MKTYLNLGCGYRYQTGWTNVDYVSTGDGVLAHNLLQGIPFSENSFEVVYHSHILEHFSKADGKQFIQECYRVLKPNGTIRIAVPDLEQIVREYTKNLEKALEGDAKAPQDYEWIMLELYDQVVRSKSGGEMADYIFQPEIPNEDYVFARLGEEARNLRKGNLASLNQPKKEPSTPKDKRSMFRKVLSKLKNNLRQVLFQSEIKFYQENLHYITLGKFRLGGEIHQWMYDSYSLSKLLTEIGFKEVKIQTAFESQIPNWNSYELETKEGIIFKPDSLFIEAKK
ncbi:class I SAM-dependent methyltransferase [Spirosoma fluviale]|uniref:Methyltransferase domain-containing protein n=1 Tax=Spirosoma fluviale TaxID=1597977 RepID=A0A286FD90_9BACT|nr:methyltransferase domain-containing protein [Spirosoma fluviale]SOD81198.1 Methyltransferase domain-containing protein [Spirosoma fluviale]